MKLPLAQILISILLASSYAEDTLARDQKWAQMAYGQDSQMVHGQDSQMVHGRHHLFNSGDNSQSNEEHDNNGNGFDHNPHSNQLKLNDQDITSKNGTHNNNYERIRDGNDMHLPKKEAEKYDHKMSLKFPTIKNADADREITGIKETSDDPIVASSNHVDSGN